MEMPARPPFDRTTSICEGSMTPTQSQRKLPLAVWTSSARWPIPSLGSTPIPVSSGSSSRISMRCPFAASSSSVVQAWPPCRTYCRSSSQMAHREGGPAVGACWTAHVTQMYDFTDVRRCRRLRRRRHRWGGLWDEGFAARAALRVRADWRRRRSKCSGERDSSAGRDDHRLLLPRAHLDGDRRHHRRRPLDERLHSLRRVLLPLARRRHVPGLRLPHRRGRQRDHAPDGERPHVDRRGCVLRSQGQLARVGRDGPLRRSSRGRPGKPDPAGARNAGWAGAFRRAVALRPSRSRASLPRPSALRSSRGAAPRGAGPARSRSPRCRSRTARARALAMPRAPRAARDPRPAPRRVRARRPRRRASRTPGARPWAEGGAPRSGLPPSQRRCRRCRALASASATASRRPRGPSRHVPQVEADRIGSYRAPPQLQVVERADRFQRVLVIERVAPRERRRDVVHAGPSTMYVGTTLPAPAVTFSSALDETRASVPLTRPQNRYGSWSMDRSRKCIRSRSTGNGYRGTATRSCTTYDAPSAARKDCSHSCWSIVQPRTTPLLPYSSFGFSTSRSLPPITKSPRSTTLPA